MLVWDSLNTHVSRTTRRLIDARLWLAVYQLSPYAPEFNAVEGMWSHQKRSLGNLTKHSLDELTVLVKTRLKKMQYRLGLIDGLIAKTGLNLQPPRPQGLKISRGAWGQQVRCTVAEDAEDQLLRQAAQFRQEGSIDLALPGPDAGEGLGAGLGQVAVEVAVPDGPDQGCLDERTREELQTPRRLLLFVLAHRGVFDEAYEQNRALLGRDLRIAPHRVR